MNSCSYLTSISLPLTIDEKMCAIKTADRLSMGRTKFARYVYLAGIKALGYTKEAVRETAEELTALATFVSKNKAKVQYAKYNRVETADLKLRNLYRNFRRQNPKSW